MEDTASWYSWGAWPLGDRALLGENDLLLLAPWHTFLQSRKMMLPSQVKHSLSPALPVHMLARREVGDDGFFVFSVPSRQCRPSCVITVSLGTMQLGLKKAVAPPRGLGPSSGWRTWALRMPPNSQQPLFWPER